MTDTFYTRGGRERPPPDGGPADADIGSVLRTAAYTRADVIPASDPVPFIIPPTWARDAEMRAAAIRQAGALGVAVQGSIDTRPVPLGDWLAGVRAEPEAEPVVLHRWHHPTLDRYYTGDARMPAPPMSMLRPMVRLLAGG